MKVTTLQKQGLQLPIGVLGPDGSLNKSFSLRPFRMKEERALAEMREKADPGRPLTLGRFVTGVLSLMAGEVAGADLQKMPEPERALYLGRLAMVDVLYMYVCLRVESLGEVARFSVPCSRCNSSFPVDANLNTMEVRVIEKPAELEAKHTMAAGLPYMGATRKVVTTKPMTWAAFEAQDVNNIAALKAAVLQACIVGMDGIEPERFAPIPLNVMDEMTKRDVELLTKHIELTTPGPQMAVEAHCHTCRARGVWPINWSYDSFFAASSL